MSDAGWLLVSVSTAGGSPSLRVLVWRQLKALGALYLQHSVCLLPDRAVTRDAVAALAERVSAGGGTARVLTITVVDAAEDTALREQLQADRDLEYAEVLTRLPSFFTELDLETTRGRTTFEELEESEVDLARFRAWMAKIAARDYFDAPRGAVARAELVRAEQSLAQFADLALQGHDGLDNPHDFHDPPDLQCLRAQRGPRDLGGSSMGEREPSHALPGVDRQQPPAPP